jgi:hypothetical protein
MKKPTVATFPSAIGKVEFRRLKKSTGSPDAAADNSELSMQSSGASKPIHILSRFGHG